MLISTGHTVLDRAATRGFHGCSNDPITQWLISDACGFSLAMKEDASNPQYINQQERGAD